MKSARWKAFKLWAKVAIATSPFVILIAVIWWHILRIEHPATYFPMQYLDMMAGFAIAAFLTFLAVVGALVVINVLVEHDKDINR